jgi:hypothetical protein
MMPAEAVTEVALIAALLEPPEAEAARLLDEHGGGRLPRQCDRARPVAPRHATAYHEAWHAVVHAHFRLPTSKVSIVPDQEDDSAGTSSDSTMARGRVCGSGAELEKLLTNMLTAP